MEQLKTEYVQSYLAQHTRARLGVDGDKRKAKLLGDPRLRTLQRLAAIDLMPEQHLNNCLRRLVELESCFALTEQDMRAAPTCPLRLQGRRSVRPFRASAPRRLGR